MIALALLKRFWPYLAGAALICGFYLFAYHRGADAVQAKWDTERVIANAALIAANARTALVTDRADAISTDIGAALDARLNTTADSGRFDSLRLCESPRAGDRAVPAAVPDSPVQPSGPRAGEGGDGSAQRLGRLSAAAIDACRAVTAADELWFEWSERQRENSR